MPRLEAVSIHAPVWGATVLLVKIDRVGDVSIHAPVWGATTPFVLPRLQIFGFNPRPRVGGDGRAW